MLDKHAWAGRNADQLRRWLMLEPRGHAGLHGALLTEPVTPGAHAGLLFMNAAGFPLFSGEAVIAAVTIALRDKLIHTNTDDIVIDTPAGPVRAIVEMTGEAVQRVGIASVPSFVLAAGAAIHIGSRTVRVDVAYGGEFYAVVDSESAGVSMDSDRAPQLVRLGEEIRAAVKPLKEVHGTMFTGPARGSADLRSATVLTGGILKRSPGVAGTCAVMAVLNAMGLLNVEQTFTHEGVLGTCLKGRITGSSDQPASATTDDPEQAAISPVVEGSAWITGRHQFVVEQGDGVDPFRM
jgi:proline racemase